MPRGVDRFEAELRDLERRIASWRRRRPTRAMPEELWVGAVALARENGVLAVSRALGLGYGSLKRRANAEAKGPTSSSSVRFVELPMEPSPRAESSATSPTVELWGRDGSRLVIRLPGGDGSELVDLARTLWRDR